MSTSGSIDFNLVTNEIIDEAYDLIGIGSEGEAITADMYERARRSANLVIKTWGTYPHLWTRTTRSVTLLADTASYALTPKPMRITGVRRRITTGSLDTPLREMSAQEYDDTPNKSVSSIPIGYYYDPQGTTGTLYVWPRPSTATAAAMTLQMTYLRRMDDFDASNNDADFPQEWLEAFTAALAVPLARKYSPNKLVEAQAMADRLFAQLKGFDNEPASLFMQPDD